MTEHRQRGLHGPARQNKQKISNEPGRIKTSFLTDKKIKRANRFNEKNKQTDQPDIKV